MYTTDIGITNHHPTLHYQQPPYHSGSHRPTPFSTLITHQPVPIILGTLTTSSCNVASPNTLRTDRMTVCVPQLVYSDVGIIILPLPPLLHCLHIITQHPIH